MVPSALDRWLVDVLVPGTGPEVVAALAAAEERGLVSVSTRRIAFRHELTRRAIAGSVPAARLIALNQHVLAALIDHDGSDVSRIVHHAAQAGDQDAIIRYGPAAGRDAARAAPTVRRSPTSVSYSSTRTGSPRVSGPSYWPSTRSSATRSERSTRRSKPGGARSRRTARWGICASSALACGGCRGSGGWRAIAQRRSGPAGRRSACWSRPATAGCSRWP